MRTIERWTYGRAIVLSEHGSTLNLVADAGQLKARAGSGTAFTVEDRKLGRVALRTGTRLVSVAPDGSVTLRSGAADTAETFQWIETFTGELTLMSLQTHRYLRIEDGTGEIRADSPGPEPDDSQKARLDWH